MSVPGSWARIAFPLSLIDSEIRKILEEEGVRFKEESLELDNPLYDLDVQVEDGIFSMDNSEARYGEFEDLETLLIQKGIPFDRTSGMDWDRPPVHRIFRPGQPNFDNCFPLDSEANEHVVEVSEIRKLIERPRTMAECFDAVTTVTQYLNEHFPAYPPLADWVKEEAANV